MKVADAFTPVAHKVSFGERRLEREDDDAARDAQFCALVARQSRFVFRIAYALLRNKQDAEDAVQETFLKLYRGKHWIQIQNEQAFLAKVAWQMATQRAKRRTRAVSGVHEPCPLENPEQAAISADSSGVVHRLIDALPEELRQPLALSALKELNSREIAEMLQIAEGTVRTRLMRARQILKQKLLALRNKTHGE